MWLVKSCEAQCEVDAARLDCPANGKGKASLDCAKSCKHLKRH